jgi:hypothetical protein
MPTRSSKRPRDPNQLAKHIVDIATGEAEDDRRLLYAGKNPAAVELGRLGGRKGGRARAEKLSPEERHRIAQDAARARWQKDQ